MKHLKNYNIFESTIITDDNLQDLEDILVEVYDMGYDVNILELDSKYHICIKGDEKISNTPWQQAPNWDQLKEYVSRVKEYLTDVIGVGNKISLYVNGYAKSFDSEFVVGKDIPVYSISIYFTAKRQYSW